MFDAFLLKLPVKHINKPDDVPAPPEVWSIRVLLSTSIYEIKELIWIHSENHSLSPPFLRIKMFGGPVSDSSTLDSLLGLTEAPPYENSIDAFSLIIDYTLFGLPAIPHRDPIPLYFDVCVSATVNGGLRVTTYRESLGSTIGSIKDQITEKFSLEASAHGIKLPNEAVLDEELTLRDIMGLDVPLPRHLRLELQLIERGTSLLKIFDRTSGRHFASINITGVTTIQEVKLVASKYAGTPPHLIRLAYRAHIIAEPLVLEDTRTILDILQVDSPSSEAYEIDFDVKDQATTLINGTEWAPTGRTYIEVKDAEGATRVVDQAALSSSTYEIELQGTTVQLDSSECIMNDVEGYVLISPAGYSRIKNKWGDRVQKALPRGGGFNTTQAPPQATATVQPVQAPAGVPLRAPVAPNQPEQNENAANPGQTVLARVIAAAAANRQNLRRIGMNWILMLIVGFDLLFLLTIPKYAAMIVVFTILYTVFIRGRDISDWLDQWILGDGAPNTLPFRIVRFVSRSMRAGYDMYHFNFDRLYNVISSAVMLLRPTREDYLERAALQTDTLVFYLVSALKELCGIFLLFLATFVPTVENAFCERDLARRRDTQKRMAEKIRLALEEAERRDDYESVKRYIEHSEGPIESILTYDCGDLVKAFFTVTKVCRASPADVAMLNSLAGVAAAHRHSENGGHSETGGHSENGVRENGPYRPESGFEGDGAISYLDDAEVLPALAGATEALASGSNAREQ